MGGSRFVALPIQAPPARLLSSPNGSHEGYESDEGDKGDEGRRQRYHDCDAGIWLRRGNHWIEVEGRKGHCRGHCQRRSGPVEEKWLLQARWGVEPEVEEEARPTSS